jgi:hypothetical protein
VYRSVSYTALLANFDGVLTLASAAASVWGAHGPAIAATATRRSMPRIQQNASIVWRFILPSSSQKLACSIDCRWHR